MKKTEKPPKPRRKPREITPEEDVHWREDTVQDARITPKKVKTKKPPAERVIVPPRETGGQKIAVFSETDFGGKALMQGEYANIDHRTAWRFSKGEQTIDATLDLHGLTREQAYLRLVDFIASCQLSGKRVVLVITGKGTQNRTAKGDDEPRAVLRQLLPQWLNDPAVRGRILAYDRAQQRHGGGGAWYVLLKRIR